MDKEPQPVVDAVVFKPINKEISSYLLPYRQLYNVEVLDCATGTIPQNLDTLKTVGPFQVQGWVPLEETALAMANYKRNEKGRLVFIKAECIVEWTHEYNHQSPMRPKIWVLSNNIGWYQIQSVKDSYEPYFEPLVDVCAYLNAINHVVTTLKVKDELDILIPEVASLLSQPVATVREKLALHRDRMTDLCSSDSALRKLAIYKNWNQEKVNKLSDQSSRDHRAPTIQPASPVQTTHSTDSKDHAMEEYEETAHTECVAETFGRLTAPCSEDMCPLHFQPQHFGKHNALDVELRSLVYSKYVRGHTGWSIVSTFQCPIQNCLCTITNAVFSSVNEFAATIMQHISKHDHSKDDIKALLKAYLVQPQNQGVKPASQDMEARDPNAVDLNVHLYWALKSGGYQIPSTKSTRIKLKNTPQKTKVVRTTRATTRSASTSSNRITTATATATTATTTLTTTTRPITAAVSPRDRLKDMRTDFKNYHIPPSTFLSDTPPPSDDGSIASSGPTSLGQPQSYENSPLRHTSDEDDQSNSLHISTSIESKQKRRHGENTVSDEKSSDSEDSRIWYRSRKRQIRRPLYMEDYLDEYSESDIASSDECLSDNRSEPIEIDSDSEESIFASDDSDGVRISTSIQDDTFSLSYVYEPYLRCRECRRLMRNASGHLCKRD